MNITVIIFMLNLSNIKIFITPNNIWSFIYFADNFSNDLDFSHKKIEPF